MPATTPEVFGEAWMAQVAATLERISNRAKERNEQMPRLSQNDDSMYLGLSILGRIPEEAAAMTTQQTPGHRVRIEVSTSVRGIHTYSCTVERADVFLDGVDVTTKVVAAESAVLVRDLDALYPKEA